MISAHTKGYILSATRATKDCTLTIKCVLLNNRRLATMSHRVNTTCKHWLRCETVNTTY